MSWFNYFSWLLIWWKNLRSRRQDYDRTLPRRNDMFRKKCVHKSHSTWVSRFTTAKLLSCWVANTMSLLPIRVRHNTRYPATQDMCACIKKKHMLSQGIVKRWVPLSHNKPSVMLLFFLIFGFISTPQSTIFQLYRDGSSCVVQVLSKDKCVLIAERHICHAYISF